MFHVLMSRSSEREELECSGNVTIFDGLLPSVSATEISPTVAQISPDQESSIPNRLPVYDQDAMSWLGVRIGCHRVTDLLGRGMYGAVFEVYDLTKHNRFAMKVIDKPIDFFPNGFGRLPTEVFIMDKLRHENIISLKSYLTTQRYFIILMELASGNSLASRLSEGPLSERMVARLMRTIAQALHFMHESNVVHMDIKLDNIVIGEGDKPMIIDFGWSKMIETRAQSFQTGSGTSPYSPPESKGTGRAIGVLADTYAFGVCLHICLTRMLPTFRYKERNLVQIHEDLSSESIAVLEGLLHRDPNYRMTLPTFLKHPWVENNS